MTGAPIESNVRWGAPHATVSAVAPLHVLTQNAATTRNTTPATATAPPKRKAPRTLASSSRRSFDCWYNDIYSGLSACSAASRRTAMTGPSPDFADWINITIDGVEDSRSLTPV